MCCTLQMHWQWTSESLEPFQRLKPPHGHLVWVFEMRALAATARGSPGRATGLCGRQANLGNLRPFLARHWTKGLLSAPLILVNSLLSFLLSFPLPLLVLNLGKDMILGQRLGLLLPVVWVMVVAVESGMLTGALQEFYFVLFEQEVLLDVRQDLLNRTLRLRKSFFDDKGVGYLMSRLSSDVLGCFLRTVATHLCERPSASWAPQG